MTPDWEGTAVKEKELRESIFRVFYFYILVYLSTNNGMASGIDIYSQLLISIIRISDTSNSIIDITIKMLISTIKC